MKNIWFDECTALFRTVQQIESVPLNEPIKLTYRYKGTEYNKEIAGGTYTLDCVALLCEWMADCQLHAAYS